MNNQQVKQCLHPKCQQPMYRNQYCCRKHYAAMPDELRDEFKQVRSGDRVALELEVTAYFEDRMVGDYDIVTCRKVIDGVDVGCGADVIWMTTSKGKMVTVNAESVTSGDLQYDPKKHEYHLEHCENRNQILRTP